MINDLMMPIETILKLNYDKLKRDELGIVQYSKELKTVADNLLQHPDLQSGEYASYDDFFNALIRKYLGVELFELPKDPHPEYKYVNQVLSRSLWESWKLGNRIFIAAGTGRGKNTFIKKELLKCIDDTPNNPNQKIIIFENRVSLMQQQILDIVDEIDPEAKQYTDLSDTSMIIFGRDKNIMIITYQTAAYKCALNDSRFMNFLATAQFLVFDEAHYMLDDASFNKGINFFMTAALKAIPHRAGVADTQSDFSSDCMKMTPLG